MNVEGLTRENVASHLQVTYALSCCHSFKPLLAHESSPQYKRMTNLNYGDTYCVYLESIEAC